MQRKNDILNFAILHIMYIAVLYNIYESFETIIAVLSGIVGLLLQETINYIGHYGLLRKKLPCSGYERNTTQPSWNSNHSTGRKVLYELTRHSDHQFKPKKKYQKLTNHQTSPQLPNGYPTTMVLAFIPFLRFKNNKQTSTQIIIK